MDAALLAAYALTVLMLIATPGPVVALVIGTATRSGMRRALETALGTNGGSLVLIAAAALVISGTLAFNHSFLVVLSLLGCLYLGYVAVEALLGPAPEQAGGETLPCEHSGGFLVGLLTGLSNPKDIVFFVSFFPQFARVTESLGSSLAVLTLVWIVLDLLVLGSYILLFGRFVSADHQRLIARASALILRLVAVFGFGYNLVELRTIWLAPGITNYLVSRVPFL